MKKMRYSTILIFLFAFNMVFAQGEEHMKKGDNLFSKGKYEEAIIEYSKSIEYDEDNLNAHLQRAMAYNITKQYQKAIDDYNKVLDKNPGLANVKNSRGSSYMKLKIYDKAIKDFNDILNADSKNQEAYNNRGWCKKHLGDDSGACEDWKKSKKLGNSEAKIILKNSGC